MKKDVNTYRNVHIETEIAFAFRKMSQRSKLNQSKYLTYLLELDRIYGNHYKTFEPSRDVMAYGRTTKTIKDTTIRRKERVLQEGDIVGD